MDMEMRQEPNLIGWRVKRRNLQELAMLPYVHNLKDSFIVTTVDGWSSYLDYIEDLWIPASDILHVCLLTFVVILMSEQQPLHRGAMALLFYVAKPFDFKIKGFEWT